MVGWEGGEGLLSKNSLQDFTLISEAEEYQQMDHSAHSPENISVPPFGSLLEFRQLRRLDATISVLVGREDPSDTQTDVLANANIDAETLKHEAESTICGKPTGIVRRTGSEVLFSGHLCGNGNAI
ncbi:hypothetical protein L207DRAFT_521386 [Hyaloscypha variabilis F]|uniref:Uncharacterized protein n=1 Tax=Hyaloscypha variabilis (strain UAMH 11265 / GT02V1 / F) TaxID=1149755 RepID=A0A2J6QRA6_HYAVF|nr:hypothetical protein L207DRAFT_521386 [Hyaloscypha variabilis F]